MKASLCIFANSCKTRREDNQRTFPAFKQLAKITLDQRTCFVAITQRGLADGRSQIFEHITYSVPPLYQSSGVVKIVTSVNLPKRKQLLSIQLGGDYLQLFKRFKLIRFRAESFVKPQDYQLKPGGANYCELIVMAQQSIITQVSRESDSYEPCPAPVATGELTLICL